MNELGHHGLAMTNGRPAHRQSQPYPAEIHSARIPWTSARCNRLLRPLSSKISLLRKESQLEPDIDVIGCATNVTGAPFGSGGRVETHRVFRRETADADAEWEANPRPRKKVKRTYSAKTRVPSSSEVDDNKVQSQVGPCISEAVIDLPSQLILEARPLEALNPLEIDDQHPRFLSAQNPPEPNPLQALPKSLAPSNWKLVDGICKGLVALLKVTTFGEPPSTFGCRSLFSTCLRQVPKYIADEERLSKADDPDGNTDMPSVIYNDLEEFGSLPGGGWEPLKEVVRAHGTKMVTDAVEEGLLGLPVARHLFNLCLDVSAYDEAQCIIESLTKLATPVVQPLSRKAKQLPHDLQMVLNSLDCLVSRSGRRGFSYRHTAAMLNRGIMPLSWISSKPMIGTWNGVIQSIAQEDEDAQAGAALLHTVVAMSFRKAGAMPALDVHGMRLETHIASHRPVLRSGEYGDHLQQKNVVLDSPQVEETDSEVCNTLSSVLTVLSAITQLRNGYSSSSECTTWISIVCYNLALEARQIIDSTRASRLYDFTTLHVGALRLPLLAISLIEVSSNRSSNQASQQQSPFLRTLAGLSSSNETTSFGGSFVCAVARCCGRARSEDPFKVVQSIVQDLIRPSKPIYDDAPMRKLCKDLALAAAFAFSEDTSRPNHLDWALHVELNLTGKGAGTPKAASLRTPARSIRQAKSGYRWEEGICEWIAKTPSLLLQKPSEAGPTADNPIDSANQTGDNVEAGLPFSLEASPCAASKKPMKMAADRLHRGESKALRVLIPANLNSGGIGKAPKGIASMEVSHHSKRTSQPKVVSGIYEDDDCDELSIPGSLHVEMQARMRERPNTFLRSKRRRWKKSSQTIHLSKVPTIALSTVETSQSLERHQDSELAEDELATMFNW